MMKMQKIMKLVLPVAIIALLFGVIVLLLVTGQFNNLLREPAIQGDINPQIISNLIMPAQNISLNLQYPFDYIIINATVPETPQRVPLYRGIMSADDFNYPFKFESSNWSTIKTSIPSETEAPALAQKVLERFGGLPSDAVLSWSETNFQITEKSSGEIVARHPIMTSVMYGRKINGIRVVGNRDAIRIDLGENGELLSLLKIWRTLENTGQTVPVSTPQKAIEKLQNGETINKLQSEFDVIIDSIQLGYYERTGEIREALIEPCWVFSGSTSTESRIEILVYARQFANFTATPTYGKVPLTVTFTDTSDASPTKWLWDLGDGTTSTDQNPVHTFQKVGAYTVTLKAWNDLGSDSISKTSYILIGKKAIVQQIDTKLGELVATLNAMDIQRDIKNSLTQKLGNAQTKNDDALKFIDQNKEDQANNMLNAEDNLMQAFMNEVDAQTGKAISTGDAVKLNNGAMEIRGFIQKAIETPL